MKTFTRAKTRLAGSVSRTDRAALARAFAVDTVNAAHAARRVRRVVVVSNEVSLEVELGSLPRLDVVPEGPSPDLSAAIALGTEVACSQRGASSSGALAAGVAVLLGDLPAMRPADLDAALGLASLERHAFVPDTHRTGTTLATALVGRPVMHFGERSASRHAAAGFTDLTTERAAVIGRGLRRDVDTFADLVEAVALGVGPATRATLRTRPHLGSRLAEGKLFNPTPALTSALRKEVS